MTTPDPGVKQGLQKGLILLKKISYQMSFKGKKGLGNRFLNSWYKFLGLNGKEDYKC